MPPRLVRRLIAATRCDRAQAGRLLGPTVKKFSFDKNLNFIPVKNEDLGSAPLVMRAVGDIMADRASGQIHRVARWSGMIISPSRVDDRAFLAAMTGR